MEKLQLLKALTELVNGLPDTALGNKIDQLALKIDEASKPVERDDETFLNIDEVCALIRKTRTTVWKYRKAGLIKEIGMSGRTPLYRRSDILNFIQRQNNLQ